MTSTALPMSCAAEFPSADVSSATDGARTIGPGQSRTLSLLEAATNVLVGYVLAIATQLVVFPFFGLEAALGEHVAIGLAFVGVSLARGYALRRLFERMRAKPDEPVLVSAVRPRKRCAGKT
jgi:uncharacterized membrane protein